MDKCKEFSPYDVGGVVIMVTNGMHLACGRLECIRHPQALRVSVPGDPSALRTEHLAVMFYCSQLTIPTPQRDECDVMDVQWKVCAAGSSDISVAASLVKPVPLCRRFNVDMEFFGQTQVPPEVVRSIRRCTTFGDCQDLVLLTREVNAGVRKAIDCVLRAGGVSVAEPPAPPVTCGVDFGEDAAPVLARMRDDMYRDLQNYQELAEVEAFHDSAASRAREAVLRRILEWSEVDDLASSCVRDGGPT